MVFTWTLTLSCLIVFISRYKISLLMLKIQNNANIPNCFILKCEFRSEYHRNNHITFRYPISNIQYFVMTPKKLLKKKMYSKGEYKRRRGNVDQATIGWLKKKSLVIGSNLSFWGHRGGYLMQHARPSNLLL